MRRSFGAFGADLFVVAHARRVDAMSVSNSSVAKRMLAPGFSR